MRIYVPQALKPGATLRLPDAAAHHVARVMRRREGDLLALFDGKGSEVTAHIAAISKRGDVQVTLGERQPALPESPLAVHLGLAVGKGDRMDFAIQKSVELGVAAITPLYTEFGDVRLKSERAQKKRDHWQAVAVNACEQCGRATVPVIHPPTSLSDWLQARDEPLRLVLHPYGATAPMSDAAPESAALLIGPEGGLSDSEVASAHAHQFMSWIIGPRILRMETAPIVALSLLQARFGDFA
ncbi:ribosomal RNA small subunit methyltransferase E [Kushneria pakistanensis]|uniref:Ribosomal RNA small subunit methyltransferase E n=1 Tax=Kushneria pakistanensis TaxID=1508770 RepID=A0ABQ3FHF7_9GAMM|nr:16S rRNA (uracil(1498)-N(3))-methyltransferase [Kushneria pakistanensis]GHC24301.1 ribosomal RNA small subunit methyltransferase E [Kushneria pakistanensis]